MALSDACFEFVCETKNTPHHAACKQARKLLREVQCYAGHPWDYPQELLVSLVDRIEHYLDRPNEPGRFADLRTCADVIRYVLDCPPSHIEAVASRLWPTEAGGGA
jgi:hypothetical protein